MVLMACRGKSDGSIFEIDGVRPVVHASAFVHPSAILIGDAIVPGLIQIDQFKQLIAQAREYCASCQ